MFPADQNAVTGNLAKFLIREMPNFVGYLMNSNAILSFFQAILIESSRSMLEKKNSEKDG